MVIKFAKTYGLLRKAKNQDGIRHQNKIRGLFSPQQALNHYGSFLYHEICLNLTF